MRYMLAPFRTGAVLLHKNSPSSRPWERPPRVRICAEAVMPEVLRLGGDSVMLCSTVTSHEIRGPSHAHRSEEHTSELQSRPHLVCRLLLEKKKIDEDPRSSIIYADHQAQ